MSNREEVKAGRVIKTAIAWWKTRRPINMSQAEHLENPRINCVTLEEGDLAKAVADYLKVIEGECTK